MDIATMTVEQLREAAPALVESIRQEALAEDRERRAEIDSLTLTGYEEMAEEAKNSGTSAADFMKAVVKAQKEKGANYLASRSQETKPAEEIAGDAPKTAANEEDELKRYQEEMRRLAPESNSNSMY